MSKCHINTERLAAQANAQPHVFWLKSSRHIPCAVRKSQCRKCYGTWKVPVTVEIEYHLVDARRLMDYPKINVLLHFLSGTLWSETRLTTEPRSLCVMACKSAELACSFS